MVATLDATAMLDGVPAVDDVDTTALVDVLTAMYGEAYVCGWHAGDVEIIQAGGTPTPVNWASRPHALAIEPPTLSTIDWENWSPGSLDAAAKLAAEGDGTGLAAMLDDAGITINGIVGTTLDDISNSLADSLASGLSRSQAAKELVAIIDDRARAELIAGTEMSRAMTDATLDTYDTNGVRAKTWLLSDGACPLCEENEADGDVPLGDEFTNGDPPVHPNCVCAVAPVVDV